MHNFAFLRRFRGGGGCAATAAAVARGFLFRGRRHVAHFVHVVRSRLRRAWAAAPVVGVVDTHGERWWAVG